MTDQSSQPDSRDQHAIDRAVTLESVAEGRVRGRTDPAWANMVGPFGGTTASVLLQSVLEHPERHGDPLALTLNYAGPVADGEFEIDVRAARTNRSNQHWVLEMHQGGEVVTTATALTGLRRDTWSGTEAAFPDVPAPEDVPRSEGFRGVAWVDNYDMRFVAGHMPSEVGGGDSDSPRAAGDQSNAADDQSSTAGDRPDVDTTTTMWIRDRPERPLDHVSLTSICDSFYPRSYLRLGRPVPAGTVSLTIFFLATADEIAAVGTDFVLATAHANRFHGSYHDESAGVWSRDGVLLATANQLTYFKA